MITGKDRADSVRLTALALGCSLDRASVIVAIELGESDGDLIDLSSVDGDEGERDASDDETEGRS